MELSPERHSDPAEPGPSRTRAPDHSAHSSSTDDTNDESTNARKSCTICDKIISCFYSPEEEYLKTTLGTAEQVLAGRCAHVKLFQELIQRTSEDYTVITIHKPPKSRSILIGGSVVELIHQETVPNHPGDGRVVDSQWIDVDSLRGWIKSCVTLHPHGCKRLPFFRDEDAILPRYLIDTHQACLVRGEKMEGGYVALSYQWGQIATLRNKTNICEQLLEPSALSLPTFASKIPQTISDAMAVVRLLGFRYLWVDALCIVQDDNDQLVAELSQMHRIYSCASFTIVATDGTNADYGLRGFSGVTAAREHSQKQIQLANSETVSFHSSDPRRTNTYYTRAWTFQEMTMSTRKLVFEDGLVEWRCGHGERYEHVFPEDIEVQYATAGPRRWLQHNMPTLQSLNEILGYGELELSFQEDAFSAFAGIQNMLHRSHQNGFIYGLPEFWFDIALTWQLCCSDVTMSLSLTRRHASTAQHAVAAPYQLPSWSWIGWAGMAQFCTDSELDVTLQCFQGFTEPITQWYTMATSTSLDRRPINSEWYKYKLSAMDKHGTLLEGWNRVETHDDHRFQRPRPHCFTHARDSSRSYGYPFPVSDYSKPANTNASFPQTAFIFAQTSRAFLYGKIRRVKNVYFDNRIWLTTSNGQHCGYIQLNNADEIRSFMTTEAESPCLRSIELVATCKGYAMDIFAFGKDWDDELNTGNSDEMNICYYNSLTDCYFVLWIEWVDGVAYRKACGRVVAEVWDQEKEKELVDLILG